MADLHVAYMQNQKTGEIQKVEAPASEISTKLNPLMVQGWVQVPEPAQPSSPAVEAVVPALNKSKGEK